MKSFEIPEITVSEISTYGMDLGVGSVPDPNVPS